MIDAVLKLVPEIYSFTTWKYGQWIPLFFADGERTWSRKGTRQGDALSNIIHSVFDKAIVDPIRRRFGARIVNVAYCDDRYVGLAAKDAAAFFAELRAAMAEHGAVFRPEKCRVHHHPANTTVHTLFEEIPATNFHPDFDFKILGGVVGTNQFVAERVAEVVSEVGVFQKRVAELPNRQHALLLLRGCFASCKVTHLLRTTPPHLIPDSVAKFDHALRGAVGSIFSRSLTTLDFEWFTLPINDSGHGLGTATIQTNAAYLASYSAALNYMRSLSAKWVGLEVESPRLTQQHMALQTDFVSTYRVPMDIATEWKCGSRSYPSQKELTAFVTAEKKKRVRAQLEATSERALAAFTTGCAKGAGQWKLAMPKDPLRTMSSEEFWVATHRAMNWNLFTNRSAVCNDCSKLIDRRGDHCLNCGSYGGWTNRHNLVRDHLAKWARRGNMDVAIEEAGLMPGRLRPGDLGIRSYKDCRHWVFDVKVKNPMAPGLLSDAARNKLAAADSAENDKYDHYRDLLDDAPFKFQPLGFEATGGCSESAQQFIDLVAKRVASVQNRRWQPIQQQIYREISCIIAREGARMVLRRMSFDWG